MTKVLIVEDDKWYAESVNKIITRDAVVTKIVHDAESAMEVIDEWQPDLLLLDMMLGTKNGLVLLHELQSYTDTRQIPVVIMSVDGKRMNLDDLRQFGVVKVLDKGEMVPADLIKAIQDWIPGSSPRMTAQGEKNG